MERAAQRSDVSSNLTTVQRNEIESFENKWRYSDKERGELVDSNGNVMARNTRGGVGSVKIRFKYGVDYSDAMMTHNHPAVTGSKNIADRIGASLSGADIAVSIAHNLKGVRSVTNDYTFQVTRKGSNWGGANPVRVSNSFNNAFVSKIREFVPSATSNNTKRIQEQVVEHYARTSKSWDDAVRKIERLMVVANHHAVRTVAKEFDFNYTRARH